jgi:hypothetical protein
MDANYPETCKTVKQIMEMVGFECELGSNGDLIINNYDSKTGSEQLFMEMLSKHCAEGSYFVWRGEEGEMWREEYSGATTKTQTATIVWN